jgi:hypothetical protein
LQFDHLRIPVDDPDTIPSRLHELEARPAPAPAEQASPLGRVLVGVLIALLIFVGWLVLGR